jgi:type II secretory pathway pseudopilin PulG
MRRPARDRHGFGLLTTLVMLAVVVALAAVIVVNLRGIEEERSIQETAADLLLLDDAITNTFLAASRYPLQLSHVATPPTAADKNSCGQAWDIAHSGNWQTKSPFCPCYVKRLIPIGTGFPLGIGVAMDTMVRAPATTAGAGTLTIRIPSVSEYEANALDTIIDTGNGRTAGKIQWTVPVSGRVDTLKFVHTRTNTNC